MKYPNQFKYTKEHEWAQKEGNKVRAGITDHAQSSLGDIVFVELPKVGRELKSGETFGVVESIKAVSDLYSPLSGKVTSINAAVSADPSLLNRDPHDSAWLIEIEMSQASQFDSLMDAQAYSQFVDSLK